MLIGIGNIAAAVVVVLLWIVSLFMTDAIVTSTKYALQPLKCASDQPSISFRIRSRIDCLTGCQYSENQQQPCVGVNFRPQKKSCDLFNTQPAYYATGTPDCQYFEVK